MNIAAEIEYCRLKAQKGEIEDLLTDDVEFLRNQADSIAETFQIDFLAAKSILDVGAGTCWFGAHVANKYGKNVLSLDISRDAMDLSLSPFNYAGPRYVGEIGELTALGMRFDQIFCSALLHHMDDLETFYHHIAELLVPGGLFIAFNEPRSPQFGPLRYLHRLWFGHSTRPFGILDMPRSASEYLRDVPKSLDAELITDHQKSVRNYEQILGTRFAGIYGLFVRWEALQRVRPHLFPEAIILALWKQPDSKVKMGRTDRRIGHAFLPKNQRGISSAFSIPSNARSTDSTRLRMEASDGAANF